MDIANRQDFLACLDQYPERNHLEVFAHSKGHLVAAMDEVGFDDFQGRDYGVIGRLAQTLEGSDSEAALWGRVFIGLWYCSNFGGQHWVKLLKRNPENVRYAIQAAYWVFAISRANGGAALAAILNRSRCWNVAEQHIRQVGDKWQREWWQRSVLSQRGLAARTCGRAVRS
jgi:hypothetical protein